MSFIMVIRSLKSQVKSKGFVGVLNIPLNVGVRKKPDPVSRPNAENAHRPSRNYAFVDEITKKEVERNATLCSNTEKYPFVIQLMFTFLYRGGKPGYSIKCESKSFIFLQEQLKDYPTSGAYQTLFH